MSTKSKAKKGAAKMVLITTTKPKAKKESLLKPNRSTKTKATKKAEVLPIKKATKDKKPETKKAPKPDAGKKQLGGKDGVWTKVRDLKVDEKLPPQAFLILKALDTKKPTSNDDLIKSLEGKITSRQPIKAVVRFYRPLLIKQGLVKVTTENQDG